MPQTCYVVNYDLESLIPYLLSTRIAGVVHYEIWGFLFSFSFSLTTLPPLSLLFQAGLVLSKWPTLALSSWHPSAVASWSLGLPVQATCSGSLHNSVRHWHSCQCSTSRMFCNLPSRFSIEERGMLCSYLSYYCQALQGITLPIHLLPL